MKANERLNCISERIRNSDIAISGSTLAKEFSVSRQIIVKDIAQLKAQGLDIISTTKGYILHRKPMPERVFKTVHSDEDTEHGLLSIVDAGGEVVNVFVWHKIYGRIEAALNIKTPSDVAEYIKTLRSGRSSPLKNVTNEYHYHLIRANDDETLDNIAKVLNTYGYLVPED